MSVGQHVLVPSPLRDLKPDITSCRKVAVWKLRSCFCGAPSLKKRTGLQFAVQSLNGPSRAEAVTILYCLIWDSPNLEGQVPVFIFPRNRVAQLLVYPGHWVLSIYVASYDSQGYSNPPPRWHGGPGPRIYIYISPRNGIVQSKVKVALRPTGQSISMPCFFFRLKV
jgi:hypothetical protein